MSIRDVNFRFPLRVDKSQCWEVVKHDGTKEAYLVAVASSDTLDSYWEYFAVTALNDMVAYARERKSLKPHEGIVELRETHWSTAAIGTIVDGYIRTNNDTQAVEFWIVIKLKMDYAFAREIFNDVMTGVVDKQLSVGGWIDWEASDEAYELEWQKFIAEESSHEEIEILVGRINRFILEHVATTLPSFAANDDTRFIEGMMKSFKDTDFQEKMRKHRESLKTSNPPVKNRINVVERLTPLVTETIEELKSIQRAQEEERMINPLEAAKDFLKSLVGKSEEEVSEVLKESGITGLLLEKGVEGSPAGSETGEEVEEGAAQSVLEGDSAGEEASPETAKSDPSESDEATFKALEDLTVKISEINEKLASLDENDSSAGLGNFIDSSLKAFEELDKRLRTLENTSKVAKGATYEQGEDLSRDKSLQDSSEESSPKGFWLK